jgi:SAM-dependent methyltransferase
MLDQPPDHAQGHQSYVANMDDASRFWLRSKPFSAPPTYELARCLHSFAHIVDHLGLWADAEVLDVGCGPGWLSEWLARCGYQVTGIDVSEDMIAIARQRVEALDPVAVGTGARAEFHALAADQLPWTGRFDAAVLYDAMHHLDDERATLRRIFDALNPGGRIYIHEGVRPEPGSAGERELIEEMERYGTLEAPFDPEYLAAVLGECGFVDVERLVEIDALMAPTRPAVALANVTRQLRRPETNTFLAMKPLEGRPADALRAEFEVHTGPAWSVDTLTTTVRLTNRGSAIWRPGTSRGAITVGPYLPSGASGRDELQRVLLTAPVRPGEFVDVVIEVDRARLAGATELRVDAVSEQVAWLGDLGGQPLVVALPN